jgi:hypothetical protein
MKQGDAVVRVLALSGLMMLMAGCATQGGANGTCPIPKATTDQMLSLNFEAFDQDMSGGWRSIIDKENCELRAAQVVSAYVSRNTEKLGVFQRQILQFHAGQMWANTGHTRAAISAFEASKNPDGRDNEYRDATIAFLQRDRAKFDAARATLLAQPKPPGFDNVAADFKVKFPQAPPMVWPLNLDVVDKLGRCFNAPYATAYQGQC